MLLADKHNLQQELKLNLLHIEEKELNYYTQNCYTVGTQAALFQGGGRSQAARSGGPREEGCRCETGYQKKNEIFSSERFRLFIPL